MRGGSGRDPPATPNRVTSKLAQISLTEYMRRVLVVLEQNQLEKEHDHLELVRLELVQKPGEADLDYFRVHCRCR